VPGKKKSLSALKALRQSRKHHLGNRAVKTRIKSVVTSARAALTATDTERMGQAVKTAAKVLDKAAGKGAIHPNAAARKKSRLMRRLALKSPSAARPPAETSGPAQ